MTGRNYRTLDGGGRAGTKQIAIRSGANSSPQIDSSSEGLSQCARCAGRIPYFHDGNIDPEHSWILGENFPG